MSLKVVSVKTARLPMGLAEAATARMVAMMLKDFILNDGIKRIVVLKDWIDGTMNGRLGISQRSWK